MRNEMQAQRSINRRTKTKLPRFTLKEGLEANKAWVTNDKD
jgi:hypothetical protein